MGHSSEFFPFLSDWGQRSVRANERSSEQSGLWTIALFYVGFLWQPLGRHTFSFFPLCPHTLLPVSCRRRFLQKRCIFTVCMWTLPYMMMMMAVVGPLFRILLTLFFSMTFANSPAQMKQKWGVMSRKQSPLFREDALGSTSLVWTWRRPGVAHKYTKQVAYHWQLRLSLSACLDYHARGVSGYNVPAITIWPWTCMYMYRPSWVPGSLFC